MNVNTDRMSVKMYRNKGGAEIPIAVNFKHQKMQVLISKPDDFYEDTYRLEFNALRTPASNLNDKFYIQYVRTYDLAVVISNDDKTTVKNFENKIFKNLNFFMQ